MVLGKRRSYNRGFATRPPLYVKKRRHNPTWKRKTMRPTTRALLNYRIGGYLGIENKFVDHQVTQIAVTNDLATAGVDPAVGCLCAMAQGDGESDRDGRKVTLKSIHIHGSIQHKSDESKGANVRFMLVQDTQTNGSAFDPTEVLKVPPNPATHSVHAFRNLQHSSRYKVLYDKTFVSNPQIAFNNNLSRMQSNEQRNSFRINRTLNIPVIYNGTTSALANITDNSFHVLCISDHTSSEVFVQYDVRTRFVG